MKQFDGSGNFLLRFFVDKMTLIKASCSNYFKNSGGKVVVDLCVLGEIADGVWFDFGREKN